MKRTILCSLIAVMGLAQLGTACEESPLGMWNGTFTSDTYGPNGTITNWIVRGDGTTEGHWELNIGGGTVISFNPSGNYTYDDCQFEFSCSGTAYESGSGTSSGYTLHVTDGNVTGDSATGDYIIFFTNTYWPPSDSGTWSVTREPAAISNHVFYIEIEQEWDYDEPSDDNDLAYKFEIIIATDNTVNLVEFLTPAGNTFEIPNLPGQWDDVNQIWTTHEYDPCEDIYYWEYSKHAAAPSELDSYGDGWYTITVFYQGGGQNQTEIWFGIPYTSESVPQPTQEPNITNLTNRQRLQSPVTFEWQPCIDPNATSIWIGPEKMLGDEELEITLPVTDTNYGPVDFNDGYWEVDFSFEHWYDVAQNADGVPYEVGKYSESAYMFGIGILAELTGDNIVDFRDFAEFAQGWLDYDCYEFNNFCDRADLNFDEHVDYDDLQIMCEDWLAQP